MATKTVRNFYRIRKHPNLLIALRIVTFFLEFLTALSRFFTNSTEKPITQKVKFNFKTTG